MPKAIDITGRRFGMLTAIKRTKEKTINGAWKWECLCDCGKIKTFGIGALNRKHGVKSCGCNQYPKGKNSNAYKHGLSLNRNTLKYKKYQREKYDMCKYNLSATKKVEIFSNQKGCCAICG